MRTTVTLDHDVESLVRQAMKRGRKSFKQALNEGLRRGLAPAAGESQPKFVVHARSLGMRSEIDPSRIRDLDGSIEEEEFLRKSRALKARGR